MKGYFGIGIEGPSKAVNVGTLFRTAHAFGASFVFTVRAQYNRREGGHADTSDTPRSVPTYHFAGLEDFRLPLGCRLVGVEISAEAIELPSFRHPRQAAYILGAEREGLGLLGAQLAERVGGAEILLLASGTVERDVRAFGGLETGGVAGGAGRAGEHPSGHH